MNRRELLAGAAAILWAEQAQAFGIGQLGLGEGRLGGLGKAGGGTNPLAPFLGQVATRTYLPDASNTTNKQLRSRSAHVAMDTTVNPTVIFPNFFVDGFGAGATYAELGVGATSTITASIEYPSGTFTQITFSGSASGTIPSIGTLLGTATVTIAKGDWFWVRAFINNAGGIVFSLGGIGSGAGNVPGNFNLGDVLDSAVSGLTDNTMGGAYTATSGTSRYSPIIIAAQTALPAVLVIGDSKAYGENDAGDNSGDIGETQRWLHPFFATANWGVRGRDASQFVANCTIQTSFNSYFTHLINEDGVNCFIHGQTALQAATNTDALAAKFPTLKKYVTTILPSATTTDNYATTINQTTASYNAGRVTENNRRRGVPTPWLGCFESADAVESSRDSGLIAPAVSYFVTASSVHPARPGYVAIRDANRAAAKSTINRNGTPLTFANQVFIDQTDHAEDATSQTTYTWSAKNFLIGKASAFRLVVVGIAARFGTTGATANSCTIGGVSATKIDEAVNVTGGAETVHTIWAAAVPTGTTATVSAVFSTTMLRAGCDVWTAIGDSVLPTVSSHTNAQGAAATATASALTVPSRGGAIAFSSTVNGSLPTVALTNHVPVFVPTLVGGTLYYESGAINQAGSKAFTATWNAGTATTLVALAVSP